MKTLYWDFLALILQKIKTTDTMSSVCGPSNLTVVCLFVFGALVRAVLSIIITLEVILMYILITRKYVANELLLMIIVSTIFFEARIRP